MPQTVQRGRANVIRVSQPRRSGILWRILRDRAVNSCRRQL